MTPLTAALHYLRIEHSEIHSDDMSPGYCPHEFADVMQKARYGDLVRNASDTSLGSVKSSFRTDGCSSSRHLPGWLGIKIGVRSSQNRFNGMIRYAGRGGSIAQPSRVRNFGGSAGEASRLFETLQLTTFTDEEIKKAFDSYDTNGDGILQREELMALLRRYVKLYSDEPSDEKAMEARLQELLTQFDANKDGEVCWTEFHAKIVELGQRVDPRVYNIAGCMVMTGTSIGVITPVLPLLIRDMGLSTGQFGLLTSVFSLVKLLANVPCAHFCDRYGRKPLLTYGLGVLGMGVGGIGLASSLEELLVCRAISGIGVAMLTTGAGMYISDISTPLNRARTMAPMTAGFAGGTAVGPAIGGAMANSLGVQGTFLSVGGVYALLVLANKLLLKETMPTKPPASVQPIVPPTHDTTMERQVPPMVCPNTNPGSSKMRKELTVVQQWTKIMEIPKLRSAFGLHTAYWFSFAGSQMTLLPMMLVSSSGHSMSVGEMGMVFACMSVVNVLGAQPMAMLSDRVGKGVVMVGGCASLGTCMALIPMAHTTPQLAAVLGVWAMSVAGLSTAPTARVVDNTPPKMRAQALALQRIMGDIGMLVGAAATGLVADVSGIDHAFQMNAALLLATSGWFGAKKLHRKKQDVQKAIISLLKSV
eukprot:CAMPEP_0114227452 /NCGR_PEP_ID=MMETSP0058-20121206/1800_1 /TAXON_ID=36894 /ORGANISM="Pyramimonas parkeae, CCMP726" /LENGTH=645 /DNA_ID=CAMNT_0001338299 /DNA_START=199 /DNA_END=2136 /DNA_ORIENTATION=-